MVVGNGLVRKCVGQTLKQVMVIAEKGKPARLDFLNNGHLDTVDQRKAFAFHLLENLLCTNVVGCGLRVVKHFTVIGVLDQRHLAGPGPLIKPERTGADRVLHDLVAIFLDHLPCDNAARSRVSQQID